jgi:peptidyl-prolyl cis-trans isomerase B (cyclophilin B)
MGEIGDAQSVGAALSALGSPALSVKQEALSALARLPLDPGQRDQVVPYVGHPDAALRSAALRVIARSDLEQLALLLSGSDPDPEWSVRAGLVRAVGEGRGDLALDLALSSLRDPDPRVVPAALDALARLRGAAAREVLVSHLRHDDPVVRVTAARGLLSLEGVAPLADLQDAYRRSLEGSDLAPRLAFIAALEALPGESATQLLREISERDPSATLRERAVDARRVRGEPGAGRAHRRPRPAADYRLALTPFAPLPQLKLFTPRVFLRTKYGSIELHLNVVEAPMSSGVFADLARRGYFTDLAFDDVTPGIAVMGGCPRGDGRGGAGYLLPAEIGTRPFGRGAVALLGAEGALDLVGSRFLITLTPAPDLEGRATLVGWVADGIDALLKVRPGDVIERADLWDGRQ